MANTETFGLILYLSTGGGSPNEYTKVAGVTNIPQLFGFDRSTIDTSEIDSTVKTFLAGQLDPGTLDFELKFDPGETTHGSDSGLVNTMTTRGLFSWVLKIPASTAAGAVATYMYFQAVTVSLSVPGAQDDVLRGSCSLKISGLPVFVANAPTIA